MSKNKYSELRARQEKEFNNFPMVFAFSKEQFKEGMEKLGLNINDTDKIYSFAGNGFYKRSDAPMLKELFNRHDKERKEAIEADTTGEGYIYDMFLYELNNHEYCYTGDTEDTLQALDITEEEIYNNPIMLKAFRKAKDIARCIC